MALQPVRVYEAKQQCPYVALVILSRILSSHFKVTNVKLVSSTEATCEREDCVFRH